MNIFWSELEREDTNFSIQLDQKSISSDLFRHGGKFEDTTDG